MARKKTQVDLYEGIPLSAFEGVMNAARPFIAANDRLNDYAERITELKRSLNGPGRRRNVDRRQIYQEIRELKLQIVTLTPHLNETIDVFCQACLNFRNLIF